MDERLTHTEYEYYSKYYLEYYPRFSAFAKGTYDLYMNDISLNPVKVSKMIRAHLILYLNELNIDKTLFERFKDRIEEISKKLMVVNAKVKQELLRRLPSLCNKLTDLNSAVMGVPNDHNSDLDFIISIRDSDEQRDIGIILESIGYKLTHIYEDNLPKLTDIKWHSYHKYVDDIEIEIKVRYYIVIDSVSIAHRGIKYDLSPLQKKKVSFIKSVLSHGDLKTYKTFKYILCGAMFNGHRDTIIFRHS